LNDSNRTFDGDTKRVIQSGNILTFDLRGDATHLAWVGDQSHRIAFGIRIMGTEWYMRQVTRQSQSQCLSQSQIHCLTSLDIRGNVFPFSSQHLILYELYLYCTIVLQLL